MDKLGILIELLPQQLIISNKAGGGGAIAFNYVASKRADPYVMVAVPSTAGHPARFAR